MSYHPIMQVTARNYANMIMRGAPTNATFKPANGQFAYCYVYPQKGRPTVGIIYSPSAAGEVYFASKTYDWVGVKIGNQYSWVNVREVLIEPVIEPEATSAVDDTTPEPDVLVFEAEPVVSDELQEVPSLVEKAVAEAWDNITAQELKELEELPIPKRGRPKKTVSLE